MIPLVPGPFSIAKDSKDPNLGPAPRRLSAVFVVVALQKAAVSHPMNVYRFHHLGIPVTLLMCPLTSLLSILIGTVLCLFFVRLAVVSRCVHLRFKLEMAPGFVSRVCSGTFDIPPLSGLLKASVCNRLKEQHLRVLARLHFFDNFLLLSLS